jgi:release factor glutamine methyltransferase
MGREAEALGPFSGGAGLGPGLTSRQAVARVAEALGAAGIEGASGDARRLVAGVLGASSLDLLREPDRTLIEQERTLLDQYLQRRVLREPVSRILGVRGFYGRDFRVSPHTLDPRPCTETVVDAVLEVVREEGLAGSPLRIIDVGTGSGCLIITLLAELPQAQGIGTDISLGALEIARENSNILGVASRLSLLERSYLEGVTGPFDILVSNPPYIPRGDVAGLEPEVRCFDPLGALDGGGDGLDAYRALASGLPRVVPSGWAFFEVGCGQAPDVSKILRSAAPRATLRTWNDLGGHQRCVATRTQS